MSGCLNRLRELGDQAAPPPWSWYAGYSGNPGVQRITNPAATLIAETFIDPDYAPAEAEFIVAARNLWPNILAVIGRAVEPLGNGACRLCGWLDGRHYEECPVPALERAVEEASK